ncbi:BnaA07g37020D [Brassica napus]|uniref:BnaA07g37020D protein n=1 Tax=Brassica napus TaxID=3708 RepID=A0A078IP07_BRANA|nr:BnaA07g37020D [Brassica napus]
MIQTQICIGTKTPSKSPAESRGIYESHCFLQFHSQAQDKRHSPDPRIPFNYCYDMSSDANASLIPSLSLTMKGNSHFTINDPIIVISTEVIN